MRLLLLEPAQDWTDHTVETRLTACVDLLAQQGLLDTECAQTMHTRIDRRAHNQRTMRDQTGESEAVPA